MTQLTYRAASSKIPGDYDSWFFAHLDGEIVRSEASDAKFFVNDMLGNITGPFSFEQATVKLEEICKL